MSQLINQQIDIHQHRTLLKDADDGLIYTMSNILIYSSFYYPCSKSFLLKIIKEIKHQHAHIINYAIEHLLLCLEREVVTGPSSSYFPPSDLPQIHHRDSSLLLQSLPSKQRLQKLALSIKILGLEQFFEQGDVEELDWYNCSQFLSLKNLQQHREGFKQYEGELELEGESWLQATPYASLFCTINLVLQTILQEQVGDLECNLRLLWARLSFLHNKCLKHPVKKLSQTIIFNYSRVLELRRANISREEYIELLLEYSFALLFYYKYNRAEAILRHCSKILQMKIEFIGKLGRRTKYQQFDTPQLVMNITNNSSESIEEQEKLQEDPEGKDAQFIDAKKLVAKEKLGSPLHSQQLKASSYDEESILLQTPKFVEGQQQKQQKIINEHHLLVTLAILYFEWRSSPHDQMQYQNISASVMTLLKFKNQTSFSYNFSLLLLRSLNQFPRVKHAERALDQFENLRLAYNNKVNKNASNLYSTPYETHLGYILILADKYMEIGLSLTAIELFQQAGLYEQCVDVLIQKEYKEKALQILNRLIEEKGKNPRILCMLGDIYKNEVIYYEEAWELSKQRSSRAMRSLGWIYYYRKNFAKAAECFSNATQVSYYHPSTWFTLGCCYMNCKQYEKSLRAFVQCVSIDQTQGQAWGNIASCYMHQKKMKEAFSTLQQAVKYSEGSWMLWANLIKVSLVVKKFYKYFQAIERVVKLGHHEVITEQIMKKVVQVMCFKNDSGDRRRVIFNYRNRINRLYEYLEQKIGVIPLVWRSRCDYQIQILEYISNMSKHYHELHSNNTIDLNDIVPGYETLESTALTTQAEVCKTKANIVAYKQCELNMTMKVGWQQSKMECQKVKKILLEYIETYRQYSDRVDKQDFKLFVRGISQKISHCLQQQFQLQLQWE